MGIPFFKIRDFAKQNDMAVLSSNYSLYGDLSHRLMMTLQVLFPQVEVYSIDEAFLHLQGGDNLQEKATKARETVYQWLGLPVSIGIGPTKTLAKLANKLAKDRKVGVFVLKEKDKIQNELSRYPIEDIWGVGRQIARSLRDQGLITALDLQQLDPRSARQQYTVIGERLVRELRGEPCLAVEDQRSDKKSMQIGRSFSRPIRCLFEMEQAVTTYVSRLAEKLRQRGLYTYGLRVYMRNSPYHQGFHYQTQDCSLHQPLQDTHTLIKLALTLTRQLFKPNQAYHKAGVTAYPLTSHPTAKQTLLFEEASITSPHHKILSTVIDQLNDKYGQGTLRYAVCGLKPSWAMKAEHKSPAYTTRWKELMKVGS
jgi:DNA polymerase V